jgi:hypothetical protein
MMRDLKKKKSCEPGFCRNIPLGGATAGVTMRDLKKKKNREPGFCAKTWFGRAKAERNPTVE